MYRIEEKKFRINHFLKIKIPIVNIHYINKKVLSLRKINNNKILSID